MDVADDAREMSGRHQILVVEDNPANLMLLQEVLTLGGFSVICADNAEDGLQLALERQPDLILMDLAMPVVDGFEARSRLLADPATRHIPVVAVTAHALPVHRERVLNTGFQGYLSKPLDTRLLADQLLGYLESP